MNKDNNSNISYFKIFLGAFFVIAASMLFACFLINFAKVTLLLKKLLKILSPFTYGLIISYLLSPVINYFETKVIKVEKFPEKNRKKIRAGIICVLLIVILLMIAGFFNMIIPEIGDSINNISKNYPRYERNVTNWFNDLVEKYPSLDTVLSQDFFDLQSKFSEYFSSDIMPRLNEGITTLTSSILSVVKALFNLIIGFIVAVTLMYNKESFIAGSKKFVYGIMKRSAANSLIHNIRYVNKTFQNFFVGKIIDSIVIGLICYIVLVIIQMPYSLLISIIIGITNIVPVFGPFIGAVPSTILVFMVDPVQALYFVIFIIILQQFDGNILGPKIMGSSIGISGFWVLFAIIFFGGWLGFWGMIVGVPIFAIFYTALKAHINTKLEKKGLSTDKNKYLDISRIDSSHNYIKIPKEDINSLSKDDESESKIWGFLKSHFFNNDDSENIEEDNKSPINTDGEEASSDNNDKKDI